ncbi:MAG: ion channel [Crocinitomicaceae bacterium]
MARRIKDPGIGTKFDEKVDRIINADGSYNVVKIGAPRGFRDIFKYLVEVNWSTFFLILFSGYILLNLLFTFLYMLCGFESIDGVYEGDGSPFLQTFFFSVQTFTTVGYGVLAPITVAAQIIAAVEAFVGFLSFSLATGLLYGRFSRPQSKLIFADHIAYSKYEEGYSLKFKMTNKRDVVLQDVEAKIIVMFNDINENGEWSRQFFMLPLTLPNIQIMALTWTVVHKIDEDSPFWEKSKADIIEMKPEFLVLVNGFDEIYSERTRSRRSYMADDILWNKNFATIFKSRDDGKVEMDVRDINKTIDE